MLVYSLFLRYTVTHVLRSRSTGRIKLPSARICSGAFASLLAELRSGGCNVFRAVWRLRARQLSGGELQSDRGKSRMEAAVGKGAHAWATIATDDGSWTLARVGLMHEFGRAPDECVLLPSCSRE
jgi:hypothetical protein